MRICLLEGDMSRSGGTERMTAWLANALAATHTISVVSLRLDKGEVFFPLPSTVTHRVLPTFSGKAGIRKRIRWIHRYIQDNRIDCVINVDMGMGFYGILAARGTGAKTVTWEHGNFFNNWGSRLFPYMRRFAARHSDAVVVLTDRDRENYHAHISRHAPLFVIPNPAPCRPYSYDTDRRVILSVGHLLENKGYHRVVELAKILLPAHPEWQWIICGEGPERQRLEKLVADAGLADRVLLPGLIQDMDAVYRQAAMLVLTSDKEGLPMVLLEGKAYGLPLVAFDIMTGPSDIVDDGINGFLVPPFDLTTMAEKLCALMDDPQLRAQMSQNTAIGMEKFAEHTIVDAWEKVLTR